LPGKDQDKPKKDGEGGEGGKRDKVTRREVTRQKKILSCGTQD